MQPPLHGDAHLLDSLAQRSLASMDVGGMEGVDVHGGNSIAELKPGRNYSVGNLINEGTSAIKIHKVQPPY